MKPEEQRNDLLAGRLIQQLEQRHYNAMYCKTAQEAVKTIVGLIPDGSSVAWGGSMTIRYWDAKEYIGAGAGAASYFHNVRYQNPSDTEKYIDFATHFKPLYKESTPLTTEEQMSEFAFLGLRKTCGISLLQFKEKFGKEFSEVFQSAVSKHKNNGLLCEKNGRLFLSEKGMDLANYVMEDFV